MAFAVGSAEEFNVAFCVEGLSVPGDVVLLNDNTLLMFGCAVGACVGFCVGLFVGAVLSSQICWPSTVFVLRKFTGQVQLYPLYPSPCLLQIP